MQLYSVLLFSPVSKFCRSHLLNMIEFQLDMQKNWIWTDSLIKTLVWSSSEIKQ